MSENLSRFIDHAREKGMDLATISLLLRSSGWKEREIAEAFAVRELQLPLPERARVGSARDAFLHLLAFTAMYACVISLIYLIFTYIELEYPDLAERQSTYAYDSALSGIRAGLATLIVSFPIFLLVWWRLLSEVRKTPELAKSGVRRWLSFLSLFVGAVTIMSDVITIVYYLVEGDVTARFLLKFATILIVTGGVFVYLALTLRSEGEARQ